MWKKIRLEHFLEFNPKESLTKKEYMKKIPLDALNTDLKTIDYFEWSKPSGGTKFRNGDTLVAKITPSLENGKTGKVTILGHGEVGLGSTEFIVLRKNNNSDSDFIYYLARSPMFREKAISLMEGTSGRKRVNENALKNIDFVLPDLPNQIAISQVLSSLDNKIELNRKINAELEHIAQTIYDYWFVGFNFPDKEGQPYRFSGGAMTYSREINREIPSGWEVKKLGDLFVSKKDPTEKIETSKILSDGKYPVITQDVGELIKGYTNSENPITDFPVLVFGDHSCTLRYVNFPFFRGADGTQLLHFETEELLLLSYFWIKKIIPTIPNYGKYERHFKYLKDYNIVIPDTENLVKFTNQMLPLFTQIQQNNKESIELKRLRDWLLPMLMNGQISVNNFFEKAR